MRLMLVVALALSVIACSKGLDTIESAEAFAKSRGVVLTEKTEDKEQIVAPRCFDYKGHGADVRLLQFNSHDAAAEWKKRMDGIPIEPAQRIQSGHIVIEVRADDDATQQKVVAALQP
ncbi:hypothetical protein D7X74_24510 [Corallococcus sp. CA047B]|uniref:hypothetical protein n=1 Tax=Corallococcus sp. CA047B TaxID=2316729 RepID=UPI000EA080B0|nr:hypothetical protein [Corallococcus sp. CA047B]RKH11986.1 hypothetical protein D7X74_24510 [Corallococcus sp. CA047B]